MCEFLGYPTIMIKDRKVLRVQGILPTAPAVPMGLPSDVSEGCSSSQGSDSSAISLTSANELSVASTNPDIQQLVAFMSQQHGRLTDQIVSLNATVKRLAEGQEALSEVSSAAVTAVTELRRSVREQLEENKRETEATMTRTIEQCKEAMLLLRQPSGSGDTGVSGPPGARRTP
jgi:ElaB/YqjD/DUF883 family membrane-anchored ribosome-binding protein